MRKRKGSQVVKKEKGKAQDPKQDKIKTAKPKSGVMEWLWEPVPSASLGALRIIWGLLTFYEIFTYFAGYGGKVTYYHIEPKFSFKYYGFGWVPTHHSHLFFILHLFVLLFSTVTITIGLFYRLSSVIFLIGFSWLYLMDMSYYLNHFYLLIVLQVFMTILPANCIFSFDSEWSKNGPSRSVPRICILLIRWYMVLVYFYAGVQKINPDWLGGEPLRHWLRHRVFMPGIGRLMTTSMTPYFFSYGGLVYDLVVGFMLVSPWWKVKLFGICLSIFFHITNKILFNIGIFPVMCLAVTTIFFSPRWPISLLKSLEEFESKVDARLDLELPQSDDAPQLSDSNSTDRGLTGSNQNKENNHNNKNNPKEGKVTSNDNDNKNDNDNNNTNDSNERNKRRKEKEEEYDIIEEYEKRMNRDIKRKKKHLKIGASHYFLTFLFFLFFAHQIYLPLRHLTYPGDVAWNEYGHRFSWRMKLRDKQCSLVMWTENGTIYRPTKHMKEWAQNFTELENLDVRSDSTLGAGGTRKYVEWKEDLNNKQWEKLKSRPENLHQYAFFVAEQELQSTGTYPKVFAVGECCLNFRESNKKFPFVNGTYDLVKEELWKWPYVFVEEVPPMKESDKLKYPWNWDWFSDAPDKVAPFPDFDPEYTQEIYENRIKQLARLEQRRKARKRYL